MGLKYKATKDGITITGYDGKIIDLVIPDAIDGIPVVAIDDRAFEYCHSLKSIKFPNSITKIGNYAFFFCLDLEEIKLPRNLKSVGDYAFMNVSKVEYIVIPKSVEDVGVYSFAFHSIYGIMKKIFLERKRVPKGWKSWHFDNVFVYLKDRWEYDENGIPVVKWMNEEEAYSFLEENKRL